MQTVRKWIAENKGLLIFLIGMVAVRSAIVDWYGIPSGSMYPNLMIGDRVISNRLAYDIKIPFTDVIVRHLADPERGDIVTFSSPQDGVRLVKRLVAVPGDVVEMREDQLVINGVNAYYAAVVSDVATHLTPHYKGVQLVLDEQIGGRSRPIIVMPGRGATRSFGPVAVPQGEYLMLGDNRDNSRDFRYIGFVKRELITGRVERIAFSLDEEDYYLPRMDRFGAALL